MGLNIQFELRSPNQDDPTSIQCFFYLHKKRFRYSIGRDLKIYPELWDKESQRPIKPSTRGNKGIINEYKKELPDINADLIKIGDRVDSIERKIREYQAKKEIAGERFDFDELRTLLDDIYHPQRNLETEVNKENLGLMEYLDSFIENARKGIITHTNAKGEILKYNSSTLKAYRSLHTGLGQYSKKRRRSIDWDDITMDFYSDFVKYHNDNGYRTNYIGKQIKNLKAIMQRAFDDEIHQNIIFRNKNFRTLKTEVHAIALTEEEVNTLYELDLSARPKKYQIAKDIFLCGCYTALRYSDYSRITKDHIKTRKGRKFLEVITKKTKTDLLIPIRKELDQILSKYNYTLPKTHMQKVNDCIKEIGQIAGINERITFTETIGAERVTTTKYKYELLMTHTARRTGATLMYRAKIPLEQIMQITGHTTIQNLKKYLKIDKVETAERLADNPFFIGNQIID